MSIPVIRVETCAVLFLLTLLSGVWLSHFGKPLNTAIFTLHKLIALATVVVIAVSVYNLYRIADIHAILVPAVVVATGLLFLALFVTGALLSLEKPASEAILRVHQVAPLLALGSSSAAIYLLLNGRP